MSKTWYQVEKQFCFFTSSPPNLSLCKENYIQSNVTTSSPYSISLLLEMTKNPLQVFLLDYITLMPLSLLAVTHRLLQWPGCRRSTGYRTAGGSESRSMPDLSSRNDDDRGTASHTWHTRSAATQTRSVGGLTVKT